jgi:hypothetical protein
MLKLSKAAVFCSIPLKYNFSSALHTPFEVTEAGKIAALI